MREKLLYFFHRRGINFKRKKLNGVNAWLDYVFNHLIMTWMVFNGGCTYDALGAQAPTKKVFIFISYSYSNSMIYFYYKNFFIIYLFEPHKN
jgi:hypothetical protein